MDLVCDTRCRGPLVVPCGLLWICNDMYPLPVLIRNDVRKAGNKLRQRRRGNLLARLELTEARTGTSPGQGQSQSGPCNGSLAMTIL